MKKTPKLVSTANLWSLQDNATRKRGAWSLEKQFAAVKAAGFDAFTTWGNPKVHPKLMEKYGLRMMGYFASAKKSDFKKLIKSQKDCGAENINVQLGDHDTPRQKTLELAMALMEESDKQDIQCYIEVHRDTATETPEKTYDLIDDFKKATGKDLHICWDHSHLTVVKHMGPDDFSKRLLTHPKLHKMTQLLHCRPFNGHHCQIAVTDGKGKLAPEFGPWIKFVEDLLVLWLKGPQPKGELWLVPELGPKCSTYGLSSFPDIWEDTMRCRKEIDKAWKRALKTVNG